MTDEKGLSQNPAQDGRSQVYFLTEQSLHHRNVLVKRYSSDLGDTSETRERRAYIRDYSMHRCMDISIQDVWPNTTVL